MKMKLLTPILLTASLITQANTDSTAKKALDMYMKATQSIKNKGGQQFVTVGTDNFCDFRLGDTKIQDAIDSGATDIRIASGTYDENITIDTDMQMTGGFNSCSDAVDMNNASSDFANRSVVNAAVSEPVVQIIGGGPTLNISIANMSIQQGDGAIDDGAGGINISSLEGSLGLFNVAIIDNKGIIGGGIKIGTDSQLDVVMVDVLLSGNEALTGGGLYCSSPSTNLLMVDSGESLFSGIHDNEATSGDGGGLLLSKCTLSFFSGTNSVNNLFDFRGIVKNVASSRGGGAAVKNGAVLNLFGHEVCNESICIGNNTKPVSIVGNESNYGGGIHMQDTNTEVNIIDGFIVANKAFNGAGIFSNDNAQLIALTSGSNCWQPGACTQFNNNIAILNGGALSNYSGNTLINGAHFFGNYTENNGAAAIYTANEDSTTTLIGITAYGNDGGDDDPFMDAAVIAAASGTILNVVFSTIADNDSGSFGIIDNFHAHVKLFSSIVHQGPDNDDSLSPYNSANPLSDQINCVITYDSQSMSELGGTDLFVDDPEFIDRANQNYHIDAVNSPAVDLCNDDHTAQFFTFLDTDGEVRGFDDPFVTNVSGSWDAGADETLANDLIFEDQFE